MKGGGKRAEREVLNMNLIRIDENGLHLVFEKKEDGTCKLLHFSALPFDESKILRVHDRRTGEVKIQTERYNVLEIMISGQDRPGERHGNKYISTAPVFAEAIRRIYEEVSISNLFD